ncbi:hypothetical protein VTO73DRAFT_3470 [Trametes versicolor]
MPVLPHHCTTRWARCTPPAVS